LSVPEYTCGADDGNATGILYEILRSSLNWKGRCNLAARVAGVVVIQPVKRLKEKDGIE